MASLKIMWICGGLLPQACKAVGFIDSRINGGFMGQALNGLIEVSGDTEFCILSWDSRVCDVRLGRVRHVSFGGQAKASLSGIPKRDALKAFQIISEFKPDVIHILGTEGFFAHLPSWVFNGRKTVISVQGIISACAENYDGGLSSYDLRGTWLSYPVLRYGLTVGREKDFWKRVRSRLEVETMQRHANFIGRTDFDFAWVRSINPKARYFRVNESMRPEFYGANRDCSVTRKHVIYCGGATSYPLKGGHIVLKALAFVKNRYSDVVLRIANSESLREDIALHKRLKFGPYTLYLRRLIKELKLEEHVTLLPPLSGNEVRTELEEAMLFVLPSFCENSPNALAEAMLVGTPVISAAVGGVCSMIRNNETGLLVPPGDPAVLAQAICSCFEDPDKMKEMVRKAKIEAMERHDLRRNSVTLFDTYKQIIGG